MSPKANAKYVPKPTNNRTTYILGAVAVIVIAVVVIGGVMWQSNRNKPRNEGYGSVQNTQVEVALQPDGVIRVGAANAPTTIEVFEDPLCPVCGEFEKKFGQEIAQKIDEGKLAVDYHMLNFLNEVSHSGDYSTRAVAASQCVAESGNAVAYGKFHDELFSPGNQPAERGSSDHTNDELGRMARDAGANDAAVACITSGEKVQGAGQSATAAAQYLMVNTGRVGTPTVLQDGKSVDTSDNEWVANLE
ncbi:DsbA family protein [Antrihabitans sp. YC2-6]|uniref:DsbA family protein n=1 Tax=Antrihabitans sp. YC2-6 TaxID=2799498 RepID=UPI0018F4C352|nr:DsbA family protein [Antrihabitans sp. YC2-6]MBJ8343535.1 DsbA family protein [Antrihabitans sp. YC2-6]